MLVKNFWEIIQKNKMDLEQIPIRKGFGEGLMLAGKNDDRVVALCADLTESTQIELFKKSFPERYFEMGVSEQNMASVASGMAAMGKIPFISSYAMFSPGRNWEQIRTTILYNNVPVKIAGNHAGLSPGPDGGTHQAIEDVAILRTIPNIVIVVPCDAVEAKKATLAIAKTADPSYLRLFREKGPVITDEETPFEIGKANIVHETPTTPSPSSGRRGISTIGIIANGEMVSRALFCVKELENSGYEVGVLNLHTIKPIDTKSVLEFTNKYKNILTVEEHQIAGGMGSAVLECLAQNNSLSDIKLNMLGVDNRFGQTGNKEELYEEYGINEKHIIEKIRKMLQTTNK
jgi:transketolase